MMPRTRRDIADNHDPDTVWLHHVDYTFANGNETTLLNGSAASHDVTQRWTNWELRHGLTACERPKMD